MASMTNVFDLNVRVSLRLSCGCTRSPSAPFPQGDAGGVGQAVICDSHQEFAVVTRHTRYLADTSERALSDLLMDIVDDDRDVADSIASEQAS